MLKSFPSLKVLLYGEAELTESSISEADVVLMPVFEMPATPRQSVDVSFSSYAMSGLSRQAMTAYLDDLGNMTTDHFVCIGDSHSHGGNIFTMNTAVSNSTNAGDTSFRFAAELPLTSAFSFV